MADTNAGPTGPRRLLEHLGDVLPLVRVRRLGLMVDFDGTISEIVPTPDEATVTPASAAALERLSRGLALVCVVSGRAASDVRNRVGVDGVLYVGNHGAEFLHGGRLSVVPGADKHRPVLAAVSEHLRASADGPGVIWQDKGISLSVHYRLAPDHGEARRALTEALESAPGVEKLEAFWGKMLLELRAPTGVNKGYALRKLAEDWDLDGLIFLGDDVTDVDALRALRDLAAQGRPRGLGVGVIGAESPSELLSTVDYTLSGVGEVEEFLGWLGDAVP